MKLTGYDAIEFAEREGLTLNKAADNIDDAAVGLTVAEAEAIAEENPDLIWLIVAEDEYYHSDEKVKADLPDTVRIAGHKERVPRRRAGLLPDEMDVDEVSEGTQDIHAAGTVGGGGASGGLAGTNAGDGSPENADLENAAGSGIFDHSGDRVDEHEPEAGHAGGAVGGTPAGKRGHSHRGRGFAVGGDSGRDSTIGTNPHRK